MTNLIQRSITGILFVAVIVCCTVLSPIAFGALFAVITALTIREFCKLVNKDDEINVSPLIAMTAGAYLFFAFMGYSLQLFGLSVFIPYIIVVMYAFIRELYLKQSKPLNDWAYTMMSQLYIALPFSLLNVLAYNSAVPGLTVVEYNPTFPLAVFIFIWINDTGAYCVGSLLGKHRLFERISPKKSWEGSIGGGVFALIAACVMAWLNPFTPLWVWLGFALTVVFFGTWGDLIESLMKRQLGIKDSGSILPGHGGWLDRFDSALMAIPASVVYLYLVGII